MACENWADAWQAYAAVVAVAVNLAGFALLAQQLKHNRTTLAGSIHTGVYNMGLEIHKTMIQHPEIRAYFYSGKSLEDSDSERDRVFATCELLCDYFEFIICEQSSMSQDIRDAWLAYMRSLVSTSSAIRAFVDERRQQYTTAFLSVYDISVMVADAQVRFSSPPTPPN